MKKFLCMFLALGMAFSLAACGKDGDTTDESSSISEASQSDEISSEEISSEESSSEEDIFIPDYSSPEELTEYFEGKTGTVTYNTGKNLTVDTLWTDTPIYLGDHSEDNVFTVDGGDLNRRLTVVGSGGGVVQANGGILVFKNLVIKNESELFSDKGYRDKYAEFGGKVRFENCTIACSIQLRDDADAEFINCEIQSIESDMYSIWVADGSVRFDGCTFTGYRAIKAYEQTEYNLDVESIVVENCLFDSISVKPGVALDLLEEENTTVIIRGCTFTDCHGWTMDSFEGVDGVYESDVDTTKITFIAENNIINGVLYETLTPEKS